MKGSEFIQAYEKATAAAQEALVLQAFADGHFPAFLRQFVEVVVAGKSRDGATHEVRYRVAPDYLSVGEDADYVLMPMLPDTAQRIVDSWGCLLPTERMVEQIHAHATRLTMGAFSPPHETTDIAKHSALCLRRRVLRGLAPGAFTSGDKKDIVITPLLVAHPDGLAIYGGRWDGSGKLIQSLTATAHNRRYKDYSHGVRAVAMDALLDGQPTTVAAILADANLCPLLSHEGRVTQPRYHL